EEEAEDARTDDVDDRLGRLTHVLEIGRVLDVGRAGVPLVGEPALDRDALPMLVAAEDVGVFPAEEIAGDVRPYEIGERLRGRPDVAEMNRVAVRVDAERLVDEVDLQ